MDKMTLTDEQWGRLLEVAKEDGLPRSLRQTLKEAQEDAMTWGEATAQEFDFTEEELAWVAKEVAA